jgi:hypothetical protein
VLPKLYGIPFGVEYVTTMDNTLEPPLPVFDKATQADVPLQDGLGTDAGLAFLSVTHHLYPQTYGRAMTKGPWLQ